MGGDRRSFLRFAAGIGLGAVAAETYERLYNMPSLERRFSSEVNHWMNEYNSAKEIVEKLSQQLNVSRHEISRLSGEINNWKDKYNALKEEANGLSSIFNASDAFEKESTAAISVYKERMEEARRALQNTIEKYRVILGDERVSFESSSLKVLDDLKITQEKLLKVLPYFPLIKSFSYNPSKVVNDKIYDLSVTLEVISPLNTLAEVEVKLVPVEYSHLPREAFPEEEVKTIKLQPKGLEREMFDITFADLKGGREYSIKAVAKDVADSTNFEERKTPYIREFENIAPLDDIWMEVSYMPWSFEKVPMKDETPLLGRYDTADEIVQWKHKDWADGYGIDEYVIDMDGLAGRYSIPINLMEKGMRVSVFLGPADFLRGTNSAFPDWAVDLEHPHNYNLFLKKMKIVASWAKHTNYSRIGIKPLVMIYDSIAFLNNSRAYKDAKEVFKEITGTYPYLIADEIPKIPYTLTDIQYYMKYKDLSQIDALTGWAGYANRAKEEYVRNYEELYVNQLRLWFRFAQDNKLGFIPTVIPGFDNSYSWGPPGLLPIERATSKFEERLNIANKYIDNNLKIIRIDTFNDFGEWSYIEPSTKTGFAYLEALRNLLTGR